MTGTRPPRRAVFQRPDPTLAGARREHDHHSCDDNRGGGTGSDQSVIEPEDEAHHGGENPEGAGEARPTHRGRLLDGLIPAAAIYGGAFPWLHR